MSDLYRSILANALFPAFESLRGRPTVPLLRHSRKTEWRSTEDLRDMQVGALRRLIHHAQTHTAHYRGLLDELNLDYTDFNSVSDLSALPLLDRKILMATVEQRRSAAPPFAVITKRTSGSSGEPAVIHYNEESRHWRDAMRLRGYGWAGYEIGMRALHYWAVPPKGAMPWWKQQRANLDRAIKRELYVDSTPRSEDDLLQVVMQIRRFNPQVMVAYANGAAALARYVNDRNLRTWDQIPVLSAAEALTTADRASIEKAFGPTFDTYGCREFMLIGAECEAHDGLHVSMENLIVEIVVRDPSGKSRAAVPGETGEVVVTDLHNLACPMIRYVTGDLAVARPDTTCRCGRGLSKIGQIEGRVTETLQDGRGRAVSGLVFNIIVQAHGAAVKSFQVLQRADRSVIFKVVPATGHALSDAAVNGIRAHVERYLPGVPLSIENVSEIPLTPAGKRRVVVVEKAA